VNLVIVVERLAKLMKIVEADDAFTLAANPLHRGQEQAHEHREDCYRNQNLE